MMEKSREEKRELVSQVEKLRVQNSITIIEACQAVGISNSGYYKWRRQAQVVPQKSEESALVSVNLPEATKASSEDGQILL